MWKTCHPIVNLWRQVGSSLMSCLLVAILALSTKDDLPVALGFLTLVALSAEIGIAFVVCTLLTSFPFYLAKLGIARQHWLIES
ncbi:hypothetical protein AAG906_004504 [Vitis piasezkii]